MAGWAMASDGGEADEEHHPTTPHTSSTLSHGASEWEEGRRTHLTHLHSHTSPGERARGLMDHVLHPLARGAALHALHVHGLLRVLVPPGQPRLGRALGARRALRSAPVGAGARVGGCSEEYKKATKKGQSSLWVGAVRSIKKV